jgi:hypothetical protein
MSDGGGGGNQLISVHPDELKFQCILFIFLSLSIVMLTFFFFFFYFNFFYKFSNANMSSIGLF